MVLIIRCWSKWSSFGVRLLPAADLQLPLRLGVGHVDAFLSSRFRWSGRCFGSTTWKARSPFSKPSLMKGISTRYSSSLEWKKAQTWHERLRTDPANRTGSVVLGMIHSFEGSSFTKLVIVLSARSMTRT